MDNGALLLLCAYETECVIRNDALDRLPVRHAVPELLTALAERGTAVLSAPPGTGKTTLVPLALAGLIGDGPERRVLVAEPRRMAVRAAARRMAWLLGEEVGGAVGFAVRGERRAGPSTRVEVVTTGILLQRLQRDPELAGVDVVLLDECHERHLDADTAMAFLVDVRATLRPELKLIAASATSDAAAWADLLTVLDGSGPAPVVWSKGEGHGSRVFFAEPPSGIRPAHGTWVDPALLRHVAATVRLAMERHEGDVLCFLPGTGRSRGRPGCWPASTRRCSSCTAVPRRRCRTRCCAVRSRAGGAGWCSRPRWRSPARRCRGSGSSWTRGLPGSRAWTTPGAWVRWRR